LTSDPIGSAVVVVVSVIAAGAAAVVDNDVDSEAEYAWFSRE
jgi:hypothetical protein